MEDTSEAEEMKLRELIDHYVEAVKDLTVSSDALAKYDHAIFEAAVEWLYGAEIWKELNPFLNER